MDRLFRLGVLTIITCFAVAWFGLGKAFAQGYEYTPKVTSTTGGTAKTTTTYPAKKYARTSYNSWTVDYDTHAASCAVVGPGWNGGYSNCTGCGLPEGMCQSCTCGGTAHYTAAGLKCDQGGGIGSVNGSSSTEGLASATCYLEACPQGTTEGAGGLCYPMVCPTATPSWEPDPNDSTQCRRPVECPYPQKFVVASGTCECDAGTLWAVPPEGGLANPVHGSASVPWTSSDLSGKPTTACMSETGAPGEGGCTFNVSAWGWNGSRLQMYGDSFAGTKCTVGSNNQQPSLQCPVGQVVGTINGSSVCVQAGTTETTKPPVTTTETKTNTDGTTTTTQTTTQETTKCEGGICTTTITKTTTITHKDAQGNTTGTETSTGTTTQPGKGTGNGTGDGEGTPSSFGGSCPAFNCEGDAVQCAIALEQHKRNCELLTDVGAFGREDAEGKLLEVLADESQLTTEGSLAGISSSTFLGGSCLADQTFAVAGSSFTIPFSSLCSYLQAAGLAFLAVCSLLSFGVVARGVTA